MLQGRVQGIGGRELRVRAERAARARRDRGRRRSHRQELLGRHAPPPRHRARPRASAARALPRRADDRPRPGGARRDVGGGLASRRGRDADDPAHDALPRGGRPARRPARDRLAGEDRRRGNARRAEGRLRGDAVHVELENGAIDEAQRVLAAQSGARPEQVLDGPTIVSRVENGGRALPGIIVRARRAPGSRRLGLRLATVARRRLPALHRPRLHGGGPRPVTIVVRHTWFMTAPAGAQPDARADLDRPAARAADGLARALRAAVQERDAARRLRHHVVRDVPRARRSSS